MILFGQSHHKFWNTVLEVLKTIIPAEAVSGTEQKFKALQQAQVQFCFMKTRALLKAYKSNLNFMPIIFRSGQNIQQQLLNLQFGMY